jgi:hypothetical protein
MLGCVAAVIAIESPSQLSPALSQRIAISSIGAGRVPSGLCCARGWGMGGSGAMRTTGTAALP